MTTIDSRHGVLPAAQRGDVLRQSHGGLGDPAHIVRIAVATTIAWVLAATFSPSPLGLFAPLTTVIIVQAWPWTTLSVAVQAVLGTSAGVLVAAVWVNLVGQHWWSFLVAVTVALVVARRAPWSLSGRLQIPVAVVYVMAIGPGGFTNDMWRVLDVLIGGAMGLLAIFAFPGKPTTERVTTTIAALEAGIVATLRAMAAEVGQHAAAIPAGLSHDFVRDVRSLRSKGDDAQTALNALADSTRMNVRGAQVRAEVAVKAELLRQLHAVAVGVRSLGETVDAAADRGDPPLGLDRLPDRLAALGDIAEQTFDVAADRDATAARSAALAADLAADARALDLAPPSTDGDRQAKVDDVLHGLSVIGSIDEVRRRLADCIPARTSQP